MKPKTSAVTAEQGRAFRNIGNFMSTDAGLRLKPVGSEHLDFNKFMGNYRLNEFGAPSTPSSPVSSFNRLNKDQSQVSVGNFPAVNNFSAVSDRNALIGGTSPNPTVTNGFIGLKQQPASIVRTSINADPQLNPTPVEGPQAYSGPNFYSRNGGVTTGLSTVPTTSTPTAALPENTGMKTEAPGMSTWEAFSKGAAGVGDLAQAWTALQGLDLARDQFDLQQKIAEANLHNASQIARDTASDRAYRRAIAQGKVSTAEAAGKAAADKLGLR